ncbi:MAG: HEAT repeat domain-containing protein, partial [Planctomycetaceae bacterium]|nr:HEAT repeat domain-containing protein [Planctomycetaceae bacterium]
MSIAVLNQVYDEVRRLAIAGSNLAAGDFRLKKLAEPLQKSAQKAPVFGKVADCIDKVVNSTQKDSAESLLELATLTTAILYTQGETGLDGKLEPVKSQDLGLTVSNTSARVLKPLIEALTTIGSGRLETIRDAHERGAFRDLRLIKHAIAAIDDKYGEIGDFVADRVLPMYGKAICPEIREGYDPKGKGDDARRLRLLHTLDPQATRELVDAALDEGSKDVRLSAIQCLEGRDDCIPFLLQQVKAKIKDVRAAALKSLASLDHADVVPVLQTALAGADVDLVAAYVSANPSSDLKKFIVEEAGRQLAALLAARGKPPKKAAPKAAAKGKK